MDPPPRVQAREHVLYVGALNDATYQSMFSALLFSSSLCEYEQLMRMNVEWYLVISGFYLLNQVFMKSVIIFWIATQLQDLRLQACSELTMNLAQSDWFPRVVWDSIVCLYSSERNCMDQRFYGVVSEWSSSVWTTAWVLVLNWNSELCNSFILEMTGIAKKRSKRDLNIDVLIFSCLKCLFLF